MSRGTIHYAIGKGTVHIPLLIDDGSTCTVATKAFFASKSPYKLLLESALKKRKQLYIGPDKETGGRTILRYSNNLVDLLPPSRMSKSEVVLLPALSPSLIGQNSETKLDY